MPKFTDHAAPILSAGPAISDEQRSDLWSLFHVSKDPAELAQHLSELPLRGDFKDDLIRAKRKPALEPDDTDKVMGVLNHMSAMDSRVLEAAESHPLVLKALIAAHGGSENESRES